MGVAVSPEELLYFAAIMLVGVPASFTLTGIRNPTAFAMVATWFVCRLLYVLTGEGMPVQAMVLSDAAVITAMFVKEDWRTCPYQGTLHQLACLWHERTPWDRAILALFPVVWTLYFPILDPRSQYWALWSLGLAQLMLAGLEAAHPWLERMANKLRAVTAERPPPGSEFHTAWRLAGHG